MSLHTKIRRGTAEHSALVEYVDARLTSHRSQLESTDVPMEKVPALRARIAELKTLLSQLNEDRTDE